MNPIALVMMLAMIVSWIVGATIAVRSGSSIGVILFISASIAAMSSLPRMWRDYRAMILKAHLSEPR